jgi:hypothetical protein
MGGSTQRSNSKGPIYGVVKNLRASEITTAEEEGHIRRQTGHLARRVDLDSLIQTYQRASKTTQGPSDQVRAGVSRLEHVSATSKLATIGTTVTKTPPNL